MNNGGENSAVKRCFFRLNEILDLLKLENDYEICRKMLGKRMGMLENTGI